MRDPASTISKIDDDDGDNCDDDDDGDVQGRAQPVYDEIGSPADFFP